jgi:hypothetical protein
MSWMPVQGSATFHQHSAEVTQPAVIGDNTATWTSNRVTLDLEAGWDILDSVMDKPNHSLSIDAVLAMATFPIIPGEFLNGGQAVPTIGSKSLGYFGGGLSYSWYGPFWALSASGAMALSQQTATEESSLMWGRAWTEWNLNEKTALSLGAFIRRLSYAYCSEDHSTCLAVGKSQSFVDEAGVFLGFGFAVR